MRYFLLIFALLVVMTIVLVGTRGSISRKPPIEVFPDMVRQPKLRPQTWSDFYPDHLSSRVPVAGTVDFSEPMMVAGKAVYPFEDSPVNTGHVAGTTNFVETNPLPVTEQLMARGQQRYNIYCAPCHGAQADGKSVAAKFGLSVVADLHDARTRKIIQQPDGEIFNTITHGKNLMGGYGAIIATADRWAIIAYLRALERSRLALVQDVPANERAKLPNPPPPPAQPAVAAPAPGTVPPSAPAK